MPRPALLLLAALPLLHADPAPAADRPRPNVLIIHCDELNFRTLGCYRKLLPPDQALMWGPTVVNTPSIDRLAGRGALCTRFYATTPVCSPSRSALVSGFYPQNTPVVANNIPLRDDIVTFAQVFLRAGYATGYAGKWHLDGQAKPGWAPRRHFGFQDNRYMFNRGHWKKLEDTPAGPRVAARNSAGKPSYDVAGADEKSFTTDFLCDRAIAFIRQHRNQPWCFMVSLPDPHNPDTVRQPYDTMFAGKPFSLPRTFHQPPERIPRWAGAPAAFQDMAGYFGMIKCIDDNVGKILDALQRLDLMEQTFIVFTADHGDMRGEHHRQNKGIPYEASARIPFILYAPHRVRPGTVVTQALSCVDFMPTLLALADLTCPPCQGRDASALFRGQVPHDWQDIAFLRSTGNQAGWLAAVSSRYKLIVSCSDPPCLFDLEKDPDELVNRFDDPACRPIVRDLARQLLDYAKRYHDPRAEQPAILSDLQWAAHGCGPYVDPRSTTQTPHPAPRKTAPRKPRRKTRLPQ